MQKGSVYVHLNRERTLRLRMQLLFLLAFSVPASASEKVGCLHFLSELAHAQETLNETRTPSMPSYEEVRISKNILSMLQHPQILIRRRPILSLFNPRDPVANSSRSTEVIPGTFAFSSHGVPGFAVVRPTDHGTHVLLTPIQVRSLLERHPLFAASRVLFVNACWSGHGLARELARITGRPALGWNGEVYSETRNGQQYIRVEDGWGERLSRATIMSLFMPDGREIPVPDPQQLLPYVTVEN